MATTGSKSKHRGVGASIGRLCRRDERGQALLEFAFASIIFFMTIFGTIEFGLAIWQYNMVSDLAQEGARWASVHGSTSATPASWSQVQTFVDGRSPGFAATVDTSNPAPSTLAAGSTVTVRVVSTFNPATDFLPSATLTLQSTAQMIVQR